jgi:DNA polymerase V
MSAARATPALGVEPLPSASCYGLADCNNFYAACETVFRPKLAGKPMIVLSNNDGCVIARSQAAKALGVTMGQPAYELTALITRQDLIVCSANFALYGDMSARVMEVLARSAPRLDVYSIDEAFLDLTVVPPSRRARYAAHLRAQVRQWTGIPVSIGLASTKTLAKAANDRAKKLPAGILELGSQTGIDTLLKEMAASDVWGIGQRRGAFLRTQHIETAYDFKCADTAWVRRQLSVVSARTQLELRGISCLPLDEGREPKQQIMSSRSFGTPVRELAALKEALAQYTTRATEKLRRQHSLATTLTVFISTNVFREDERQYHKSATVTLPRATAYTPEILGVAHRALERIYRAGYRYHKAGVLLGGFVSDAYEQGDLFAAPPDPRHEALMQVLDTVNRRFGRDTLHLVSVGKRGQRAWEMKQAHLSPHYTTRWSDLARVR